MRNIKLIIEYDGTNYSGWQRQKHIISVQEKIEEALGIVMNHKVEIFAASRTDAGVHALGQVANFLTNSNMKIENIPRALNSILPQDIVIKDATEVSEDFHARYLSKGKRYKYVILNQKYRSSINRNHCFHFQYNLDFEAMKEACKYFVGTHDFSAFRSSESTKECDIRTIYTAELVKNNNVIEFYIYGDGFLYNMVRIIVGTLVEVGKGKIKPEDVKNVILSKDRKRAGKTLTAKGLYLLEVFY